MPISWVRSVTTASMMFMMTTPPTTMKTETTPTAVAAMAPVNWFQKSSRDSEVRIEKVSSSFGPRWR